MLKVHREHTSKTIRWNGTIIAEFWNCQLMQYVLSGDAISDMRDEEHMLEINDGCTFIDRNYAKQLLELNF